MKILIIHQHFRTPDQGGAIRSYYIARRLSQLGHHVSVLSATQNKTSKYGFHNGFKVRFLYVNYDNTFSFFQRIISFGRFLVKAIFNLKHYKDYDVCYVMSTPLSVGIIGLYSKAILSIPFVFEVGDLWPDIPIQMGIIRNPVFKWLVLKIEQTIYRKSLFIVALSNEMKSLIQAKVTDNKIIVVQNFADLPFFDLEIDNEIPPFDFIPEDNKVIAYLGTLGIANKVESLIRIAQSVEADPVSIVIQGVGKELPICKQMVLDLHLNNVFFLPFGNKEEIRRTLAISDAIYVCFDPGYPLLTSGCPNKLMDGLAAGKVIFINYNGWQRELIEETGCGKFINPDNPETCRDEIAKVFTDVNLLNEMKKKSKKLASEFEVNRLVDLLHKNLKEAVVND